MNRQADTHFTHTHRNTDKLREIERNAKIKREGDKQTDRQINL